jgi:hypothetical protein
VLVPRFPVSVQAVCVSGAVAELDDDLVESSGKTPDVGEVTAGARDLKNG